jgi:hypothetical protein
MPIQSQEKVQESTTEMVYKLYGCYMTDCDRDSLLPGVWLEADAVFFGLKMDLSSFNDVEVLHPSFWQSYDVDESCEGWSRLEGDSPEAKRKLRVGGAYDSKL